MWDALAAVLESVSRLLAGKTIQRLQGGAKFPTGGRSLKGRARERFRPCRKVSRSGQMPEPTVGSGSWLPHSPDKEKTAGQTRQAFVQPHALRRFSQFHSGKRFMKPASRTSHSPLLAEAR